MNTRNILKRTIREMNIPVCQIVNFIVTGRYYNSNKRFKSIYSSFEQAMCINLWNGSVYALMDSGKRILIKRVRNYKTINVYSFDELNEESKERAINDYRNNNSDDAQFIYVDEAHESVKKFHEIFGTDEGSRSWLECRFNSIQNDILELKGLRFRTYIINNFYNDLHKGKYYRSWVTDKPVKHRKVKSVVIGAKTGWTNKDLFGKYYNTYYGLSVDRCCVLTGICYDDFLLQPIYDFIDWKTKTDSYSYTDFESLMNDCLSSLESSLESEVESRNEDDYIKETIEANEYEFDEYGNLL